MTEFIARNWVFIVLAGAMLWMHLGGHGIHGGGRGAGHRTHEQEPESAAHGGAIARDEAGAPPADAAAQPPAWGTPPTRTAAPSGRRHRGC